MSTCCEHVLLYLPSGSEDGVCDSIEAVGRGANLLFAEHSDDPTSTSISSLLVEHE